MKSRKLGGIYIAKVFVVYVIAVLGYIMFAKCFSIPVHVGVDEELYISMAKSFHFHGNFSQSGRVLNYTCVLYSVLLSVAYFFYSPEDIMFVFRMVGVCVMLTSVFPTYLLGKRIFKNEKKAFLMAGISCILPSMTNTAYCMQEVLVYPLFLWVIYLIYEEIGNDVVDKFTVRTAGIAVLSALCYFTKTYMIFVPVVYVMLITFAGMCERKKAIWKKCVWFLVIYGVSVFVGNKLVLLANGGIVGDNHYSSQFSCLFPVTAETLGAALSCSILYFAALVFYWGVLPIVLPVIHWKEQNKRDKYFLFFIFCSVVVLVGEIVVSIVLTEEGRVLFPHKVLYRYFQVLEVPILLMFIEKYRDYKITQKLYVICLVVLAVLGGYYLYIGDNQRTAIIDAPLLLLMENINRYIIPCFNVWICILAAVFISIIYWIYIKKKKTEDAAILKRSLYLFAVGIGGFFIINLVQLPLYTNIMANGKAIEQDGIEIAHYCIENKGKYDSVYFVESPELSYERAINAYLEQEIVFLTETQAKTAELGNAIIICSNAYEAQMEKCEEVGLETQTVKVLKAK